MGGQEQLDEAAASPKPVIPHAQLEKARRDKMNDQIKVSRFGSSRISSIHAPSFCSSLLPVTYARVCPCLNVCVCLCGFLVNWGSLHETPKLRLNMLFSLFFRVPTQYRD